MLTTIAIVVCAVALTLLVGTALCVQGRTINMKQVFKLIELEEQQERLDRVWATLEALPPLEALALCLEAQRQQQRQR